MTRIPPYTATCNDVNHWVDATTHTMYCFNDEPDPSVSPYTSFLEIDMVKHSFTELPILPLGSPTSGLTCVRQDPFSKRVIGLNVSSIAGSAHRSIQFVEVHITGRGKEGRVHLSPLARAWETLYVPCDGSTFTGPVFGPNHTWFAFVANQQQRPPYQQSLWQCDWAGSTSNTPPCRVTNLFSTAFMGAKRMLSVIES
jgi:hypothetical protein